MPHSGQDHTHTASSASVAEKAPAQITLFALPAIATFLLLSALGLPRLEAARPNILWISLEDINPDFGCYGTQMVTTPNIDDLARTGLQFERVFSTAGVCAPSRSAIITGAYQMSIGTQHMRSNMPKPAGIPTLPEILRREGYYCSNNSKQDYNFDGRGMWDESDATAHWRKRRSGQPFFSVFNLTLTHEGNTWKLTEGAQRLAEMTPARKALAPANVKVPSSYVDTDIVRKHLANYYNLISLADIRVGDILAELRADGLAEDTIVFLWGDHGRGLPRGKFWCYTASTWVPLIVYIPPKFQQTLGTQPGSVDRELRSLLDLFPSVLAVAEISPPSHLQGRNVFARGENAGRRMLLSARDRLGPRQDVSRAIRTTQWLYIRNYIREGAYVPTNARWYWESSPIQAEMWKHQPKLTAEQSVFFSPAQRPAEELYAWEEDREETNNRAGDPAAQNVLIELRAALESKLDEIGDSGFVPEYELYRTLTNLHERGASPLDLALAGWPERPGWLKAPLQPTRDNINMLLEETRSSQTVRRYWGLRELMNMHEKLTEADVARLAGLLQDESIDIRLQAARVFLIKGRHAEITNTVDEGLAHAYPWARTVALGILDEMPPWVARRHLRSVEGMNNGGYVNLMRPYLLAKLGNEKGETR